VPGQEHEPPLQLPPVGHPLPHVPQFEIDVFRFVSHPFDATPSQLPKPLLHDATAQAPPLQPAVAFASEHDTHAPPPVPQVLADCA
jgi:hypothetical protein